MGVRKICRRGERIQLVPYRYVHETQLAPRAAFLVGVSKTF